MEATLRKIAKLLSRDTGAPDWAGAETCLRWAEADDHHILLNDDPRYPELLKQIQSAPRLLFIDGNINVLAKPMLAMVGSRRASPLGCETAFRLARQAASAGLTICSGLARGIDTAGHRGALAAKHTTVAVLGTGIDVVYPRSNVTLAAQIKANGALISEFPLGTAPHAKHFPRRNRIISGLSLGVLVVEATLQSGSLITARYGLEHNREVMAVPGSIAAPTAKGCHYLLRDGAHLIESIEDILNALPEHHGQALAIDNKEIFNKTLDPDRLKLVKCVGYDATSLDLIVQRSQLAAAQTAALLSELELKHCIKAVAGGYMRIRHE